MNLTFGEKLLRGIKIVIEPNVPEIPQNIEFEVEYSSPGRGKYNETVEINESVAKSFSDSVLFPVKGESYTTRIKFIFEDEEVDWNGKAKYE